MATSPPDSDLNGYLRRLGFVQVSDAARAIRPPHRIRMHFVAAAAAKSVGFGTQDFGTQTFVGCARNT